MLQSNHHFIIGNANDLSFLDNDCIDLVVTSPPYPMIEMWDLLFENLNLTIGHELRSSNPQVAFDLMHAELEKVWRALYRVVKPGGIVCINIGDATRSFDRSFVLYPNHVKIVHSFSSIGFDSLPLIKWIKPTNSPTKFMGSGMLPPNAYVTLEHEYILIFRKKGIRKFKTQAQQRLRRESAYFWEERNQWFSDQWQLRGLRQKMDISSTRKITAAYPFEIPFRLIQMFSCYGDLVLDPFLGTGTTTAAALASGRNSIGIEIDENMTAVIIESISSEENLNRMKLIPRQRLAEHNDAIKSAERKPESYKYDHLQLKTKVRTRQETEMKLYEIAGLARTDQSLLVDHQAFLPK